MVAKTVAVAQEQHGLVFECLRSHGWQRRQRMRAGHGSHERLVIQRCRCQPGVRKRFGEDGAIDLAGAQHLEQLDREVLLQHQRHLRRFVDHLAHQLGQQIGRDGVDHPQLERPGQRVLAALGNLCDVRGLLQHALRLAHDVFAQRRHRHLVGAALKQLDVQLFFELFDGHG